VNGYGVLNPSRKQQLDTCEVYDPLDNKWCSSMPTMNSGRLLAASGSLLAGQHTITYVLGGESSQYAVLCERESLIVGPQCGIREVYCTAKTNSKGCIPSIGFTGTPSAACPVMATFDISASNILNFKNGTLFYGLAREVKPFQGGFLCAQPPLRRTPVQGSGGTTPPPTNCSGHFHFDFNSWICSGQDPSLVAGVQVNAQYWYRDTQSPIPTGLTNALEFVICP